MSNPRRQPGAPLVAFIFLGPLFTVLLLTAPPVALVLLAAVTIWYRKSKRAEAAEVARIIANRKKTWGY